MAYVISPVSEVSISPYSTTVTTRNVLTPIVPTYLVDYNKYDLTKYFDYDTGMNDNYTTQKEMTKWLLKRILDKWLFKDELSHVLKYLKVTNDGEIKVVKNDEDRKNNKISEDSTKNIEKKADWIEENVFGMHEMRKLLKRLVEELNYKWYNLPKKESLIIEAVEKTIKKKLRSMMEE